jgi:hypothetical protein
VAAAHVSKNPGISFACMKSDGNKRHRAGQPAQPAQARSR